MKSIRISKLAERDLDEIWSSIASRSGSMEIATSLIETIVAVFPLIANNPELGRSREDLGPTVRSFPVESYIVYYRKSPRHLVISRVLHGMRDQRRGLAAN
jgi:toxin ParE1/3/4